MCYKPFWGDIGIKKWSPFFCFGIRSAIFWHMKTGTFGKSARFHVPKKGPFLSRFYFYMGEKLKVPNDTQRSAQIKKLKKTN